MLSSLGSLYGNTGSVLEKDSFGNYKTDFWSPAQWQEAGRAGISIGENGAILDAKGLPLNIKELPNTTGGLGSLFKEGGYLSNLGAAAGIGKGLLDIYSVGNDLFGSGKSDRKEAKDMMRKSFNQNYAMNDMAINKFKEDNKMFRAGQDKAKASFEAPNPFKQI